MCSVATYDDRYQEVSFFQMPLRILVAFSVIKLPKWELFRNNWWYCWDHFYWRGFFIHDEFAGS